MIGNLGMPLPGPISGKRRRGVAKPCYNRGGMLSKGVDAMTTNGDSPQPGGVFERLGRLETAVSEIQETQGKMQGTMDVFRETLNDFRVTLARMEATQEATNRLLDTLIQQVAEITRQINATNERIDAINDRINERIDATNAHTNERIDATNRRIDRLLYSVWAVGAVGFGALAAAFLNFFTR